MLELLLIILPILFALVILCLPKQSKTPRRFLLTAAIVQFAGIVALWFQLIDRPFITRYLFSDGYGKITASIAAFLFFAAAIYTNLWLPKTEKFENKHGIPMQEKLFCSLQLMFVAMMTLASFSKNLGLLWVAVEATTLFSAPLIIYHRSATSLEAMWKYLLICSVGIGLALFGTFLVSVAFHHEMSEPIDLCLETLAKHSYSVHPAWFRAAFICCFVGYGLKMGLAPFHTWLPDAHSEAPSMVSLLLSGALLNCSFLAILRIYSIAPAEMWTFCLEIFIAFGLLSLLIAAFFMIGQTDYKRMLAYSSVEHMGLLALFFGVGLEGTLIVHMICHSLLKMILFLTAGNFLLSCGTRKISFVRGMGTVMPRTSLVWVVGILMICGMPPSPLFITEITLVKELGPWLGASVLILLFIVFAAMTNSALKMTMGKTELVPENDARAAGENLSLLPLMLLIIPVGIGVIMLISGFCLGGIR